MSESGSLLVLLLLMVLATWWYLTKVLHIPLDFSFAVLKMDMVGVERELRERVHGQEDAVKEVVKLVQLATASPYHVHSEPLPPRHQVVFLLGGPGVGKSLLLDILIKHFTWEFHRGSRGNDLKFRSKYTTEPIRRTRTELSTTCCGLPWFVGPDLVISQMYDVVKNPEDDTLAKLLLNVGKKTKSDKSIHFVAWSIMSNKTLEELQTADEYKSFVDEAVDTLKAYMTRHAPELHVSFVTFKPLSPEHVTQYLREMQPNNEAEIAELVAANMRSDVAKPRGNHNDVETEINVSDVVPQDFELRLLDYEEELYSLRDMQSQIEAEYMALVSSKDDMVPDDFEDKILNVRYAALHLDICNFDLLHARLKEENEALGRELKVQRLRYQQSRMEAEIAALVAANTRHDFVPHGFYIKYRP